MRNAAIEAATPAAPVTAVAPPAGVAAAVHVNEHTLIIALAHCYLIVMIVVI